ncbi:MAG TPA: hypothetical protein VLB80_02015 [Candidatus Babeliales bacterium]|nr:hypothetical protein [Candidatus Babeliales bacterium]
MKKIINVLVIALLSIAIGNSAHARLRTIDKDKSMPIPQPATPRILLDDAKKLKMARTPEQQKEAVQKLCSDLANNSLAKLILREIEIKAKISHLQARIDRLVGSEEYKKDSSAFIDEEQKLKDELAVFEKFLIMIQKRRAEVEATKSAAYKTSTKIALATLVTTVGLLAADQYMTGGQYRTALMSKAGTAVTSLWEGTKNISSAIWNYMPSLRSTEPATTIPVGDEVTTNSPSWLSTIASKFGNTLATQTVDSLTRALDIAKTMALTTAVSFALKQAMSGVEEALKNPQTNEQELQAKVDALEKLVRQINSEQKK